MEKRELVYYRLDKIDGKILDILQGNARASLKEIAEQVFLSPTAVGAPHLHAGVAAQPLAHVLTVCCRRACWKDLQRD